jgi:endonuclease/exonuclease/phosphatase family metal-dependent hydrolase
MGDLNLWPSGGSLAPLQRVGLEGVAVRSFPSRPWPAFALDRILVSPPCVVVKCWRVVAPLTTMASDHLPVVADIAMGQA